MPDIQSVAMTADGLFACVSTNDAPLYSLFILHLAAAESNYEMKIIEQRALLSVLEYEAFQDICVNTSLAQDSTAARGHQSSENIQMAEDGESQGNEETDVTVAQVYEGFGRLNCDLPCALARSVKILSTTNAVADALDGDRQAPNATSYLICSFGDGRTLTMSLDHGKALELAESGRVDQQLAHIARNESAGSSGATRSALADYQILHIGTTESTLRQLIRPTEA